MLHPHNKIVLCDTLCDHIAGPPAVSGINTTASGCLSTLVSWGLVTSDPVCGSVSYDVTFSSDSGVLMIQTTDTSYNFTWLTPDKNYTVTVVGRNDAGVGESSDMIVPVEGKSMHMTEVFGYKYVLVHAGVKLSGMN